MTIQPHGDADAEHAAELRKLVVHTVRHVRPPRLVLDLIGLNVVDPITVGTFAAACALGDDHHVAVIVDHPTREVAARLRAAGVPAYRLRNPR